MVHLQIILRRTWIYLWLFRKTYQSLYLQEVVTPPISAKDATMGPVSEDEILQVLANMKINTAPGPDGFTSKIYKKFTQQLAALMKQVFEFCIQVKSIP